MTQRNLFFLVCPLDLEILAQEELKHKAIDFVSDINVHAGGLSFTSDWRALSLNHHLKIPSRLLLKITDFKVRDLPKLFKKTSQIPWRKYVYSPNVNWKISAQSSRLIHTKKIEETLQKALEKSLEAQPAKKPPLFNAPVQINIHAYLKDDVITFELDTSGEHLHKRGLKKASVKGPLRENLAAACLYALIKHIPTQWYGKLELIDPMAGSGTFLIEAKNLDLPIIESRSFSYQKTPLNKMSPSLEINQDSSLELLKCLWGNFWGIDLNTQALTLNAWPELKVTQTDCFTYKFPARKFERVVVINPPYGERIEKDFEVQKLVDLIFKNIQASRAGLLVPRSWDIFGLSQKNGFKILEKIDFKNGGRPVSFWILAS